MREPALATDLVRAAHAGTADAVPVTVKMRAGWDDNQLNAPEFAQRMVDAGAQAITVHGRTRQQRYTGNVNLDIIAAVKAAVAVPVIANGDITNIPSLELTLQHTGADAAMIGRAALGNPWIFAQLESSHPSLLQPGTPPRVPAPDNEKKNQQA